MTAAPVSPGTSAIFTFWSSEEMKLNRASAVSVFSQERPPSQPDTFGGKYGCSPIASRIVTSRSSR